MVQSTPHKKSYGELVSMTMKALLKLVKDHHLAQHIGVYRRMNKTTLINNLRKYEKSTPTVKERSSVLKQKTAHKKPKAKQQTVSSHNITNKAPKKKVTPPIIKSISGEPFESKVSKKGKKVDPVPLRRSARIKAMKNNRY